MTGRQADKQRGGQTDIITQNILNA